MSDELNEVIISQALELQVLKKENDKLKKALEAHMEVGIQQADQIKALLDAAQYNGHPMNLVPQIKQWREHWMSNKAKKDYSIVVTDLNGNILHKDIIVKGPDGKSFHCECGCNVFRQPEPQKDPKGYKCNSCGASYTGIEA